MFISFGREHAPDETVYTTASSPMTVLQEVNLDRDELIASGNADIAEMFWPGWIGEALDGMKK